MNHQFKKIKNGKICAGNPALPLLVAVLLAVNSTLSATATARSDRAPTIVTIPSTLKALDVPEVFNPNTLYEKINGQAELYLSAGFVRLTSQWFARIEDEDSMFEIYVYDMANDVNAFSVFSTQRRDNAQKSDLARFAYQTGYSLHFVHGRYYVEMISAAPAENLLPEMTALAQTFIKDSPVTSATIDLFNMFPKKNLEPDSISLIAKDVFGFERLDRVFTARYDMDGDTVTAFVSKRESRQEAADLVRRLYQHFIALDGREAESDIAIQNKKMVEIMGTFYMMFSINHYVAGIHEASTRRQAEELAERLITTLHKMPEDNK